MELLDFVFWAIVLAFPLGAFVYGELEERGWFWPPPERMRGKVAVEYREMLARNEARRRARR